MKHRLKGLLALVLSLVMVFALATNAWAAVKIGGIELESGVAFTGTQGTATYDDATKTLTLNGFEYECSGNGIESNENLTLQLLGDNKVESNSGGAGIFVDGGNLTIDGTGSLTASGTSSGISADNVTIESGKVTATGTNDDGIFASDEVTISGGNVTAEGGWDGIYAGDTVTISGGEVKAKSAYDGISASDKVTISGGNVTATGGWNGIDAEDVTISGGNVTATGTNSDGIVASGNVTISGGNVTATGTNSDGIDANKVTISGGTVKATGKEFGIYANNGSHSGGMKVTISGGSVEAYATDDSDGIGIYAPGYDGEIAISGDNTQVTVGCATGLQADIVNIAGGSTVSIEAKNANNENAIDSGELNMSGDYQWSTDGITFNNSTTLALSKDAAIDTAKLYIKPLSGSAPGNTNPYPPFIYNPTPTPEPEKVDSAKTFDGGIGLYVTMSVLSATGGVWLAKKKD